MKITVSVKEIEQGKLTVTVLTPLGINTYQWVPDEVDGDVGCIAIVEENETDEVTYIGSVIKINVFQDRLELACIEYTRLLVVAMLRELDKMIGRSHARNHDIRVDAHFDRISYID